MPRIAAPPTSGDRLERALDDPQNSSSGAPIRGLPNDRLESWKKIASYLKRDVRTVQRWERREQMPVHRPLHDKLGSVFAFRSELDAWWESRRTRLAQEGADESEGSAPISQTLEDFPRKTILCIHPRRLVRLGVAAAAILLVGAVAWKAKETDYLWRSPTPMPNSPVWTSPALNRPRPFPATENLWHFWGGPGRPKRRLGRRSAKWNLPQFNARRLKRTRRCQSRASRACFLCRLVTRFNLDQASGWLADRRYEYLGGADCWRSAQAVSQGGQRICWHDYAQARESCPSSA